MVFASLTLEMISAVVAMIAITKTAVKITVFLFTFFMMFILSFFDLFCLFQPCDFSISLPGNKRHRFVLQFLYNVVRNSVED